MLKYFLFLFIYVSVFSYTTPTYNAIYLECSTFSLSDKKSFQKDIETILRKSCSDVIYLTSYTFEYSRGLNLDYWCYIIISEDQYKGHCKILSCPTFKFCICTIDLPIFTEKINACLHDIKYIVLPSYSRISSSARR